MLKVPDLQAFLHLLPPSLPVLIHSCHVHRRSAAIRNLDSVEPVWLSSRPTNPFSKPLCGQNLEAWPWSVRGSHKKELQFICCWLMFRNRWVAVSSAEANGDSLCPTCQAHLAEELVSRCTVWSWIPTGCMTRLWTSSSNRVTTTLLWIITPSVSTSWAAARDQHTLLSPAYHFDIVTFTLAIDWDYCLRKIKTNKINSLPGSNLAKARGHNGYDVKCWQLEEQSSESKARVKDSN